ncbi:MAG TPA: hypothetical protein VG125_14050 [Pirellulales bacterium]|jgi:hypothetical protein|nr:hypothetical protein [Pirellulales bacterium]
MNRRSVWILLAVAAVTIAAILLDPTQVVIGKLAGEAFFQGRPTRYWIRSLRGGPAREAEALRPVGCYFLPTVSGRGNRSPSESLWPGPSSEFILVDADRGLIKRRQADLPTK